MAPETPSVNGRRHQNSGNQPDRPHISSHWHRVNRTHPCPICGKADWCAYSADGRLARCQRVEMGAYKTGIDKAGVTYYLHRLIGDGPHLSTEPPPKADGAMSRRADPEDLDRVYQALLARLVLSQSHREKLRKRGLPDAEIDRRMYRTLPVQGRARIARELAERFGVAVLLSVPDFVLKGNGSGKYLTIAGAAGLLIPCRDADGRIIALKVRRDESSGGPRYLYISSTIHGGPGPGAPVHMPLGIQAPAERVRLTEGEAKADVATVLSGTPTISAPGVSAWRACLPLLRQLETKKVLIAFDSDADKNPTVARALSDCYDGLTAEGYRVEVERWEAVHKGIDDALVAGTAVEVLTGDAVNVFVAKTLLSAAAGEPPTVALALKNRVSTNAWKLLDDCQRKHLPAIVAAPPDKPDVPVGDHVPLSAEETKIAEEGDAARQRVEDKIAALHTRPVVRHLNCGRGRVLHLQRDRGIHDYQRGQEARGRKIAYRRATKECGPSGDEEHALVRMSCGRSACPWCWRRRLTKTYRRAVHCLLYASAEGNRPRVGVLHIGETDPLRWDTLERNMRRKHGGKTGRIRVRKADGVVLAVAERPFPGSRPVSPAEALDMVSAAIEQLHTGRHRYRQLGRWNDSQRPRWQLVERVKQPPDQPPIDFTAVYRELRVDGRKVHRYRSPDISGLVWRGEGHLATACPSLAWKKGKSSWPKSDNHFSDDPEHSRTPFDSGEWDLGGSPWG
ncbi:MAG TPA: DUF3854 domain-containing protein [Gemmataceae bacterium]